MRLHRFYIKNPLEYEREIIKDEGLIHQWRNVFRYNVGSEMIVFDGSGKEWDVVIEKINNREAELKIFAERNGILPNKEIILCQSLIKKDKMEWVFEKATELGVSKIIPIISERSEKKSFNTERANKIVIEASEQCGRANVPEIFKILKIEETLDECQKNNWQAVVFDPSSEKNLSFSNFVADIENKEKVLVIFIGPEGGFSDKEIAIFKQKEAKIFSLGKLILRAETASLVALSILNL